MSVKSDIGNRLRSIRIGRMLSQEEWSEWLDVEQPTVANWERGFTSPNKQNVKRLCDRLGVNADQLLPDGLYNQLTDLWELDRVQQIASHPRREAR